jgi:hypothetical protein
MDFFRELKRRNVYKVAIAYAVVGWLLVQVATATFPVFEIPNWATKLVIALVLLGFPLALISRGRSSLRPRESSGPKMSHLTSPSRQRPVAS